VIAPSLLISGFNAHCSRECYRHCDAVSLSLFSVDRFLFSDGVCQRLAWRGIALA